ncbi:hypothetical protein D3C84_665850 [compost metagenome]
MPPCMPEMALVASFRLNCAKTGLADKANSEASAIPREIFIQTSSCAMKTARLKSGKTAGLTGVTPTCS